MKSWTVTPCPASHVRPGLHPLQYCPCSLVKRVCWLSVKKGTHLVGLAYRREKWIAACHARVDDADRGSRGLWRFEPANREVSQHRMEASLIASKLSRTTNRTNPRGALKTAL